jgi:trehalose/maltose hydrolase-like predicted phosphorylase
MKFLLCIVATAGLLAGADATFVLETQNLTPYTRTYLGNGLIGLSSSQLGTVPVECFMAGVYDHATGDVPRLAVLPAWNEVNVYNGLSWLNQTTISNQAIRSYQQTLNMYDGILRTVYEWSDKNRAMGIEVNTFVSRSDPRLGAVEVEVTPHFSGDVRIRLAVRAWPAPRRYLLEKVGKLEGEAARDQWATWYPGHMIPHAHQALLQEHGGLLQMVARAEGSTTQVAEAVALDWPADLESGRATVEHEGDANIVEVSFAAREGHTYVFYKYAAVESSLHATGLIEAASGLAQESCARGYAALVQDHTSAWHRLWETDILTPGNRQLQTAIHSAMFYLLGSASENGEFSIPPMGLSSSGYYGHVFWDADTFMFPILILLHPEMAKPLVMFRYRTLERARLNARRNGHTGAMYPWEADAQGNESTPRFAYQNALYENHVNAAVALAQWQYFLATSDRDWLEKYGYPVIRETADFWNSRVSYNSRLDRYEIGKVVSVDESKIGVSDDPYTNAAAKKNLELAVSASELLGYSVNPQWEKVAQKLYLPRKNIMLLDYPLQSSLTERDKHSILEQAQRTGRQDGVMMETEFYPILAAELRDSGALDELLDRTYRPYYRPPFNVLPETPTNNNINFLTGAGAFLQQFLFGYSGLRFSTDAGLSSKFQPLLPPSIHKLVLRNVSIRGHRRDVIIPETQ